LIRKTYVKKTRVLHTSGLKIFMILPKNSYAKLMLPILPTVILPGVSSTIHHLLHSKARKRMWKVVKKIPAMKPSTTLMGKAGQPPSV